MPVTVHAHDLPPNAGATTCAVDGARTVAEAVGLARLSLRTGVIILVNGRLASWETTLQDGDVIELLPAVGGG